MGSCVGQIIPTSFPGSRPQMKKKYPGNEVYKIDFLHGAVGEWKGMEGEGGSHLAISVA